MKRFFLLLVLFIVSYFARPQGKVVIGSSPMTTADVNEISMKKLLKRSCRLPYYAGDTVADTVILKTVIADKPGCWHYCVRFKDDSARIAIAVEKLGGNYGYEITTYWKNRSKKRIIGYNANLRMSGKYEEHYQNGWAKITGSYANGNKDGMWIYYDKKGNRFSKELYDNGVLVKSKP